MSAGIIALEGVLGDLWKMMVGIIALGAVLVCLWRMKEWMRDMGGTDEEHLIFYKKLATLEHRVRDLEDEMKSHGKS